MVVKVVDLKEDGKVLVDQEPQLLIQEVVEEELVVIQVMVPMVLME
jgi:hypothetical protein